MTFGIDFEHERTARHAGGHLLHLGRGHAARAAPLRPEVDQHRHRREPTTSSNTSGSASIGSATGGSIVLQAPQRTFPRWAAATRFLRPHDGQTRITTGPLSRRHRMEVRQDGDTDSRRRPLSAYRRRAAAAPGGGHARQAALHRVAGLGGAVDRFAPRRAGRGLVAALHRARHAVAVLVPQLLAAVRHVVGQFAAAAPEERARVGARGRSEDERRGRADQRLRPRTSDRARARHPRLE